MLPPVESTDSPAIWLHVTDVLQHEYCPRFTYYQFVRGLPEFQHTRLKVMMGRDVHENRANQNRSYVRKELGVVRKWILPKLASPTLGLSGEPDEVLELDDGTMAPLDYKFATAPKAIHRTHRIQLALYGLLIESVFAKPTTRAYIVYTRSASRVRPLDLTEKLKREALAMLDAARTVIATGTFPPPTTRPRQCPDCHYRNYCPHPLPEPPRRRGS